MKFDLPSLVCYARSIFGSSNFLLPRPTEWQITTSFDSPADACELLIPVTEYVSELELIFLQSDAGFSFVGRVDEQTLIISDAGRQLRILARGAGSLLLDNEMQPGIYRNETLLSFFNKSLRTLGYTHYDFETTPSLSVYQVPKGTSVWEAFSNFYRNAHFGYTWIQSGAIVVCKTAPPMRTSRIFSNTPGDGGIPYSRFQGRSDRYAPVSEYLIRDGNGNYSSSYINHDAGVAHIERRRYLNPLPDFDVSAGMRQQEALMRGRRSLLAKRLFTVTCPGLLEIEIGDRAMIAQQAANLFVQQIHYQASAAGIFTTVTLVDVYYM